MLFSIHFSCHSAMQLKLHDCMVSIISHDFHNRNIFLKFLPLFISEIRMKSILPSLLNRTKHKSLFLSGETLSRQMAAPLPGPGPCNFPRKIPPCTWTGSFLCFSVFAVTARTAFCSPGIKFRIHDIEIPGIQMFLCDPKRFTEPGGIKQKSESILVPYFLWQLRLTQICRPVFVPFLN